MLASSMSLPTSFSSHQERRDGPPIVHGAQLGAQRSLTGAFDAASIASNVYGTLNRYFKLVSDGVCTMMRDAGSTIPYEGLGGHFDAFYAVCELSGGNKECISSEAHAAFDDITQANALKASANPNEEQINRLMAKGHERVHALGIKAAQALSDMMGIGQIMAVMTPQPLPSVATPAAIKSAHSSKMVALSKTVMQFKTQDEAKVIIICPQNKIGMRLGKGIKIGTIISLIRFAADVDSFDSGEYSVLSKNKSYRYIKDVSFDEDDFGQGTQTVTMEIGFSDTGVKEGALPALLQLRSKLSAAGIQVQPAVHNVCLAWEEGMADARKRVVSARSPIQCQIKTHGVLEWAEFAGDTVRTAIEMDGMYMSRVESEIEKAENEWKARKQAQAPRSPARPRAPPPPPPTPPSTARGHRSNQARPPAPPSPGPAPANRGDRSRGRSPFRGGDRARHVRFDTRTGRSTTRPRTPSKPRPQRSDEPTFAEFLEWKKFKMTYKAQKRDQGSAPTSGRKY